MLSRGGRLEARQEYILVPKRDPANARPAAHQQPRAVTAQPRVEPGSQITSSGAEEKAGAIVVAEARQTDAVPPTAPTAYPDADPDAFGGAVARARGLEDLRTPVDVPDA